MPRKRKPAAAAWESALLPYGLKAERVRAAAPIDLPQFASWLAATADPAMALSNWERLAAECPSPAQVREHEWRPLLTLLGGSQSLANVLVNLGQGWPEAFRQALAIRQRDADSIAAGIDVDTPAIEEFARRLQHARDLEYVRIGVADLTTASSVTETLCELTALAEATFRAGYAWARRSVAAEYGEIFVAPPGAKGKRRRRADREPQPFVVFGMGKLGGGELNFSSDVDVVYLYGDDTGESEGGKRGSLTAREFFTRVAERLTRALQLATSGGVALRVDLRLRPDGLNGPIVNPIENALHYYESYGQTWERTALIQARPIAGSAALGQQFLRDVRPFVFRRYLDFATVADMKAMKAKIEDELGEKAGRGNVKLGRGGIREIEFIVQVLQLIHAGRDERMRTYGTLATLGRLIEHRYLPADEGERLRDAYLFLRNVEHKIQILHHRQTHTVPADADEQRTLARRLGYLGEAPAQAMWCDLDSNTSLVRRAFEHLFHEPSATTRRAGELEPRRLIDGLDDPAVSLQRLEKMGFRQPQQSYDNLVLLRDGGPSSVAKVRRRAALDDVAPALIAALHESADPDLALANLASFVLAVGARTSFFALLRENPQTLRMLVTLFGGSQFLANAFIRHPELLDSLVRADVVQSTRSEPSLHAELDAQLDLAADFESALDVLRRFRNQEFLRIGINDLQGVLGADDVGRELATVAQACLQGAAAVAYREVCRRYGYDRLPGNIVVLAMGKLGGGELNYNSDLDLIFVYEEERPRDHEIAHERFTKYVQCLLTTLQVPTKEGLVYYIDTRLRPSGRSGPLVSSFQGFRDYHEGSAQLWERQALIKARPVCGATDLGGRIAAMIEAFVYRTSLTPAEAAEIRRMRSRMENELARESEECINIKTGRGGLVDVEFVTQMLQLHFGCREPSVRHRSTIGALDALEQCGVLGEADATLLREGYRFLRAVDKALRLAHDRPVAELHRSDTDLGGQLQRLIQVGGKETDRLDLWARCETWRAAIRACHDRWFDLASSGDLPSLGDRAR